MPSDSGADEMEKLKLPVKLIKPGEIKNKLADVGGYKEAKLEIIEYVNFVNHKDRYEKLGARMPKGALLVGPPGTGKTLLARATAGEANIPFISCSSASLLLGGDGADKLRAIFKFAYEKAPCVLFFDEIDCIGRSRNHYLSKPETQSLTEELLVQLDGFEQRNDKLLIILASTNHHRDLDEALMRPGRFDRVIQMPHPDLPGRLSIFQVHLGPLKTSLDKMALAKRFAILSDGYSGAQISALCNEAAMIAARDLNDEIRMSHFEQALDRVTSGIKKRQTMKADEKLRLSRHDAGHAIAGWYLEGPVVPTKLCILANTGNKVACCQRGHGRLPLGTYETALNAIAGALAGIAAEEIFYDEYQTDSQNDLRVATNMALELITECGMSDLLGKTYVKSVYADRGYSTGIKFQLSNEIFGKVFEEVKYTLDKCYQIAKTILSEHRKKLDKVARMLVEKDLLTLDMMAEILGPSKFDVDKLTAEKDTDLPPGLENWKQ